jgi:hypothetical protein
MSIFDITDTIFKHHILNYLDVNEIKEKFALTCKKFFGIAADNIFFEKYIIER